MRLLRPLLALFLFSACAHKSQDLCGHIELKEGRLSLSRNEKIMVCGTDKGGEGWKTIPLPQAQYQLSILLQREAYLTPRFERQGDRLLVWSGPKTKIQTLKVEGAEGLLDANKKRKIVGEPLTSAPLDEMEKWASMGLRNQGYACPQTQVTADANRGEVLTQVQPGEKQIVSKVDLSGVDTVDPRVIERYKSFSVGDVYDVRSTQLTTSRLLADGFVQSAYFTTQCKGSEVELTLMGSVGPPRFVRFEVGASTEEFPFVDIMFRNARLDDKVSSYTIQLHLSPRLQSLTGSSQLYLIPQNYKTFIGPRFRLARASERAYEFVEARTGVDIGRQWDLWKQRWRGRIGPTLNYVKTLEGIGPEDTSFLSFEGSLRLTSHEYEANLRNQSTGWDAILSWRGQREGVGAKVNADRYDLNFKKLWNIGGYHPPLFVLGVRTELNMVDTDPVPLGEGSNILPVDYRVFYGGGENLRGFARKILTNSDFGYLTGFYLGTELRLVEELPWRIQPLLLFDYALLGATRMSFDDPIFTSLGLGMRWESPFGTVRGTAAKGSIARGNASTANYPQEWVYFLSFGQEF